MVKVCPRCQEYSKNPKSSLPGSWSWPTGPWKRLHIDFAGPENGQMYLVIVDAYSKYLEIFPMMKTDAPRTIEKFQHLFTTFGLPEHQVTMGHNLLVRSSKHFYNITTYSTQEHLIDIQQQMD